jgi:hypothetical protein
LSSDVRKEALRLKFPVNTTISPTYTRTNSLEHELQENEKASNQHYSRFLLQIPKHFEATSISPEI